MGDTKSTRLWAAEDRLSRTAMNDNSAKVAEVLAGVPELIFGSYVGDGGMTRTIELGFKPRLLFTCQDNGEAGWNGRTNGGLAAVGAPVVRDGKPAVEIVKAGFTVFGGISGGVLQCNVTGLTYYYAAIA